MDMAENMAEAMGLVFDGDMSPAETIWWLPEGRQPVQVQAVVEMDDFSRQHDEGGEHAVESGRVTILTAVCGRPGFDDRVRIQRRGEWQVYEVRDVAVSDAVAVTLRIGRSKRRRLSGPGDEAKRFG